LLWSSQAFPCPLSRQKFHRRQRTIPPLPCRSTDWVCPHQFYELSTILLGFSSSEGSRMQNFQGSCQFGFVARLQTNGAFSPSELDDAVT
jgi:hypothetical protein